MNQLQVPPGVKVLSVSELTGVVKDLMEEAFPNVWVEGEVSNCKRHSSGHIYLTLKDADSQLRTVIWRSAAMRVRFDLKDGLKVIAQGRLSVYAPRGDYQLMVERIQPAGMGALELALLQLKEKLQKLGYFARERKKSLPAFPRCLALVTSPTGAAIRDMLEILGRRWPAVEVLVCPVKVQGEGAAEEIADAIYMVNGLACVDVMIVGRGGGSMEDLCAFNEEIVAHAIFRSRIPVVSAVGHEVDVTIADLVADRRALTPSEAAELVVPSCEEHWERFSYLNGRLKELLSGRLHLGRRRLDELAGRRVFRLPLDRVHDEERKLDDWSERLQRATQQRIQRGRDRLGSLAARLESLSPLNVLGRGYSLTRKEADGVVVRNPDQVRVGDRLVTHVQGGRIWSKVEEE